MAQERFVTPEKQLLRLIEDQKTKEAKVQVQAVKHHSLSFVSLSAWIGRLSFLRDNLKKWFAGGGFKQVDIKVINNALAVWAAVLFLYFIFNISIYVHNLKKGPDLKFTEADVAKQMGGIKETPYLKKGVASYLEKIRQRDIFRIGESAPMGISQQETPSSRPMPKIVEMTQYMQLVGISWSSDPDAMIEDTRAMRTYFVKRGQMVGELKVEAIFKDKVVLSYGREETELK